MSNTLLADVVDIRRWLEEDGNEPFDSRIQRDREIGRTLDAGSNDLGKILAWWQIIRQADTESPGQRIAGFVRLATVLLLVGGLLVGLGVGSVAFAYDGSHPVNLLALLGVLVAVPLALFFLTLLLLTPGRIPGFDALRDGLSVVNPGRWAGAWLDRFADLELFGGFSRGSTAFARWQLVVFSQWFAVGFFLGVLLVAWLLVAATDLAFGWSTTLELDAVVVFQTFDGLAMPWKSWLPQAVPDAALVEASRFNRLETVPVSAEQAVLLGGWWPFVLMAILVYGLLPRLVLLLLGRWRLDAVTRSMICQDPEVVGLLDRLAPARIDFEQEQEVSAVTDEASIAPPPGLGTDDRTAILIWNDALETEAARDWLGGSATGIVKLAVWQGEAGLKSTISGLAGEPERLVIITKGWEPPLLEFRDFLSLLRKAVGSDVTLVVAPVGLDGTSIRPADRAVWAQALGRHQDPRLYVLPADELESGEHPA
jgi:hypothetical protein